MVTSANPLFDLLRASKHEYRPEEIVGLFAQIDANRVNSLAASISTYITTNLPKAIERRAELSDYRTNPYVLMTCANLMRLDDPGRFADFLFNNKIYMGLETSFGKSIEAALVGVYPLEDQPEARWIDPLEKLAEAKSLLGKSREEKAKLRTQSVWREVDKSCVVGKKRFLTSIKSGPNCINDTQVQAMTTAIVENQKKWLHHTVKTYPRVTELDIVIGLTYGTDRTTNNKENQIIVKLLQHGFVEEDRRAKPGVLISKSGNHSTRVYRLIGKDFWAFIGKPTEPRLAQFVFLEILLALAKALSAGIQAAELETRINVRIRTLANALGRLMFPRNSLPGWVRADFSENELFWFATGLTAFYDQGI